MKKLLLFLFALSLGLTIQAQEESRFTSFNVGQPTSQKYTFLFSSFQKGLSFRISNQIWDNIIRNIFTAIIGMKII